jgi:plasmid rolling circle replication initiator protein Rep
MILLPEGKESSPTVTLPGGPGEFSDSNYYSHQLKLLRYAKAHRRALSIGKYITENIKSNPFMQNEYGGIPKKLAECGNYLEFRDYQTVNKIKLTGANFCKNHLLCPLCAIRRASKLTARYLERSRQLQERDGAIKPYFVTLTMKNGEDLRQCLEGIKKANGKMVNQRREALKSRRGLVEMNKAIAGVTAYEVKLGRNSGLWHVHSHAVWLCYDRPWETELSREWKDLTGDSFIVDVRPVDDALGFIEVLSYAVKFSTMTEEQNFDAYKVLRGKRLVTSFGDFIGIKEPETLTDEPLNDLPFVELFYRYLDGTGYVLQPPHEHKENYHEKL